MPVRSSDSSVLRWPSRDEVERSVRAWAGRSATAHPTVLRIGYFGSLARGDWGVGSDVDLLVVVDRSEAPFERRAMEFDTKELPVPADLLVYTSAEWAVGIGRPGLIRTANREIVWVFDSHTRREGDLPDVDPIPLPPDVRAPSELADEGRGD